MWNPASTGVFLQRIETPESNKIVLKILRKSSGAGYGDLAEETITVLHFNPNDNKDYTLQFDPWSNLDVVADDSIDEEDINVITRLALEFRDQTTISSEYGVFFQSFLSTINCFWCELKYLIWKMTSRNSFMC
jgi:hypothetical protein